MLDFSFLELPQARTKAPRGKLILDERLSGRNPSLHVLITEIRRARIHHWWTLRKCDGFDKPARRMIKPGSCQRVRSDFARKIFDKLFVGSLASKWRLFPVPFDSRAGNFDDRRLRTIGSTRK